MKQLDCDTPVGRAWIARQHETTDRCAAAWNVHIAATVEPSPVDVLISRRGRLFAVAEVKSRDMSIAELIGWRTYLVTFEKLLAGREIAMTLRVPFLLIVGLTNGIVYWQISDADGEWCVPLTITKTTTQATSNGGVAERVNAYIPFNKAAGAHLIDVYPSCFPPHEPRGGEMLTADDIPF